MPALIDAREVAERVARLRRAIDEISRPWSHPVEIVAVTKGFGPDAIEAAVAAGCRAVGENYAQDLLAKRDVIERLGPVVHFIGHLQSNKVRHLVGLVDVWASLDRASIIEEVARRAPGATVYVQVNSTGEAGKSGCSPERAAELVEAATGVGLMVDGLMTVGPTDGDVARTIAAFRRTRELVDELDLRVCSMGMSGDLAPAVAAGSTQVRIGTSLFGPRPGS